MGRMLEILGIQVLPGFVNVSRAREDGVLQWTNWQLKWLERQFARIDAREAAKAARHREPCGAKTRKGHPCRLLSEPGKRRCKFHGGMSTGPKTKEGRERIAAAQRLRWQKHRGELSV